MRAVHLTSGHIAAPPHPAFHMGSGDLNSDLHVYTASTLPTEPSLSGPLTWLLNPTDIVASKHSIFIPIS